MHELQRSVVMKVFQRQLPNSAPAVEDLQELHKQEKNATPHPLPWTCADKLETRGQC